jgi:large conductance mechanosensitive channel
MSNKLGQGAARAGGLIQGFKEFISQGSAIDLAVGVIIGGAFALVVKALTDGFISPLIAAIFGKPDISKVWQFEVNHAHFSIGLILQALLNLLIAGAALYFFIVLPINAMRARRKAQEPEQAIAAPAEDILLLTQIRDLLQRDAK